MAPPLPVRHAVPARRHAGFSLLELIVVMSILAILAGAAIPVVSKSLTRSRINDTKGRLARLESAIEAYFEDTGMFPPNFDDLEDNDAKVKGWTGPYLRALTAGATGPQSSLDQDAWGNDYLVSTDGKSALIIISQGPDGEGKGYVTSGGGGGGGGGKGNGGVGQGKGKGGDKGGGKGKGKGGGDEDDDDDDSGGSWSDKPEDEDNLAVVIDVTPIRRRITLDEMDVLNTAIAQWNGSHLPDNPLDKKLKYLLKDLANGGYLPSQTGEWEKDGWGEEYEPTPKGGPIMKVGSKNVQ
jgi:general secretion pathway protein G